MTHSLPLLLLLALQHEVVWVEVGICLDDEMNLVIVRDARLQ